MEISMESHPRLFISYSHDNEAHKEWVLTLATHLRQHMGVDVILDEWDLRIGGDLNRRQYSHATAGELPVDSIRRLDE